MCVSYSINDGSDGLWCILRDEVPLHDGLQFGKAIKLARQIARDEHASTGTTVTVEIVSGGISPFELARYSQSTACA